VFAKAHGRMILPFWGHFDLSFPCFVALISLVYALYSIDVVFLFLLLINIAFFRVGLLGVILVG